jgi:hypothetical protein
LPQQSIKATNSQAAIVSVTEEPQAASARWWAQPDVEQLWHGVFKGGGAKGVAYGGALQAVAEHHVWFRAVAGSSAGALTATLIAAGLEPDRICDAAPEMLKKVRSNRLGTTGAILGGRRPRTIYLHPFVLNSDLRPTADSMECCSSRIATLPSYPPRPLPTGGAQRPV